MFSIISSVFPELEKKFDEQTLEDFVSCEYKDLNRYHFGLGLWIRNHLLRENDELKSLFTRGGITSNDEISSLIIRLFYVYERNKRLKG